MASPQLAQAKDNWLLNYFEHYACVSSSDLNDSDEKRSNGSMDFDQWEWAMNAELADLAKRNTAN